MTNCTNNPACLKTCMLRLLKRKEVADFMGYETSTLDDWASSKRSKLKYMKIGHRVRYRMSDVMTFLDEQQII